MTATYSNDGTTSSVALVTGAGRGIGRAIAVELAASGHAIAVGARTEAEIAEAAEVIKASGGVARPVRIDITDEVSVREAVAEVVETLGAPTVVVNNAGLHMVGPFESFTPDDWMSLYRVNLVGAVNVIQEVLPLMRAAGGGRIVNIASTAGKMGSRLQSPYNASKHAMVGLTRCLALELAADNILVNAVCPGFTDTDLTTNALQKFSAASGQTVDEFRAALAAKVPLNRFLDPSEIAGLVALLAGPGGSGMTGQSITVAGGMLQD